MPEVGLLQNNAVEQPMNADSVRVITSGKPKSRHLNNLRNDEKKFSGKITFFVFLLSILRLFLTWYSLGGAA